MATCIENRKETKKVPQAGNEGVNAMEILLNTDHTKSGNAQKSGKAQQKIRLSNKLAFNVLDNIRCFSVFDCRGILLMFLILLAAILNLVVFVIYSSIPGSLFKRVGRPGVWIFPTLSFSMIILFTHFNLIGLIRNS